MSLKIIKINDFYDKIFNNIISKGKRKEINGLTIEINEYLKVSFKNNKFYIHVDNKKYIFCRIFMDNKNISLISIYPYPYNGDDLRYIYCPAYKSIYQYLDFNINISKFCLINHEHPDYYNINLKPIKKIFTCPITLKEHKEGYIFKCGHIFNKKYILQWLDINNSCPVCRTVIKTYKI